MPKRSIAFFFIILFTVFITAPTIITIVDSAIDVSVFYGVNEEENNNETHKKIEMNIFNLNKDNIAFLRTEKEKLDLSNSKLTHQAFLECFSPPPEFI